MEYKLTQSDYTNADIVIEEITAGLFKITSTSLKQFDVGDHLDVSEVKLLLNQWFTVIIEKNGVVIYYKVEPIDG